MVGHHWSKGESAVCMNRLLRRILCFVVCFSVCVLRFELFVATFICTLKVETNFSVCFFSDKCRFTAVVLRVHGHTHTHKINNYYFVLNTAANRNVSSEFETKGE